MMTVEQQFRQELATNNYRIKQIQDLAQELGTVQQENRELRKTIAMREALLPTQ